MSDALPMNIMAPFTLPHQQRQKRRQRYVGGTGPKTSVVRPELWRAMSAELGVKD